MTTASLILTGAILLMLFAILGAIREATGYLEAIHRSRQRAEDRELAMQQRGERFARELGIEERGDR